MLIYLAKSKKRAVVTSILIAAAALIGAMIVLPWDIELSQSARNSRMPGDLRRFILLMEVFAHSLGCALILGTLLWIDEKNREIGRAHV